MRGIVSLWIEPDTDRLHSIELSNLIGQIPYCVLSEPIPTYKVVLVALLAEVGAV
ncbi:hypothetical protein AVDCRST_MAG81-2200 [uncultured Synechococcales cyanobacterium]|uniref:Uncharacterized protein n=1 Tax=uncultured Synechococcales cyanobacterium TaxID=1936017 RepID=A0A6J4VFE2_9CYAN|nr:hypothetical protein AVDCRST_MAG81-2200 [uncultured Synechococcales cyanobacterium]